MKKRFQIFSLIFGVLFAGSTMFAKSVDSKSLGPENSWQEGFDINGKKNGKYNIMVTAEDKAGNTTVSGPYNIYIDKESDLPVTGITNPVEGMRVPGHLNIVGTCVDDDTVTAVYLILDGDEDNPVKAEGTEFWSYYLPTTDLLEGPHTIEVYGVDDGNPSAYIGEDGKVDESKVVPKVGHRTKVTWQLDRRAPVTDVQSHYMGQLVSGKINLAGQVTDGNGIAKLEYSLDGGKAFREVPLKDVKYKTMTAEGLSGHSEFKVSIDTTKFSDGPGTCWFKATDKAGSVGRFAFLYFIDNTDPDVRIITPKDNEPQNGIFTIAGFAKDTIGIDKLSWTWGNESGDFELTPGNPYFVKELNATGKTKSEIFTVTAVDTMGNVVTVKKTILIDHEKDKPVVQINYPANGVDVDGTAGNLYIRGFASDDDGIATVTYRLDGGAEQTIECTGVFYAPLSEELGYGSHTISAYATDSNGTRGNTVSTTFTSKGIAPSFGKVVLKSGKESKYYSHGMELNPEGDNVLEIPVASTVGLQSLKYEIFAGKNEPILQEIAIKPGDKNANITLGVAGADFPWGVSRLSVTAVDMFGRESVYSTILNVRNLARTHAVKAGVFFTDNVVADDGGVKFEEVPVLYGYFAGGKIASVATEPALKSVSVKKEGNVIAVAASGETSEFKVVVTAENGAVYSSRPMHFTVKAPAPKITLDSSDYFNTDLGMPFEILTTSDSLTVSGSAANSTKVQYRILAAQAELPDTHGGFVTGSKVIEATEFKDVSLSRRGGFSISGLGFDTFADGVSVVEIVASNAQGETDTTAVFVRKIPYAPEGAVNGPDGKPVHKAVPAVYWLKGNDYYGVAVYQGTLDNVFKYVKASDLRADSPALVFTVTPQDVDQSKKVPTYSSQPLAAKGVAQISPRFTLLDGADYKSGMEVVLDRGTTKEAGHVITLSIDSNSAVSAVDYKISGQDAPGGDNVQTGKAVVRTVEEGVRYEADIPLANLPARITDISAKITTAVGATADANATISVVRTHENVDDAEKVYWVQTGTVTYDAKLGAYVLNDGAALTGFVNMYGEITPAVRGSVAGLEATAEGNVVNFRATQDGTYKGVSIRANGENGASLVSPEVSLVVDTAKPKLELTTPVAMNWVNGKVNITGTVTDGNGVASLEYTLEDAKPATVNADGSKTENPVEWKNITVGRGGAFSINADLGDLEDGYVALSLRAKDSVGKVSYANVAVQKDTQAPEVTVIVPDAGAVVNGENDIVFQIKDTGVVKTLNYTSNDGKKSRTFNLYTKASEIPVDADDSLRSANAPLSHMRVGTEDRPIHSDMSYTFTDAAGNKTVLTGEKFGFKVDPESDKPISEIHLPEENQVLTTDFTISGVIYDDDGPCHVYFKVDNGPYTLVNEEEVTSYKIFVPITAMTDNEHTVSVYAIDRNGVKGDVTTRKFRISLEEPRGGVTAPEISKTVKETVTIKGWASDKNDIGKVQISIDNGASFNDATGTTEWTYSFDTRVVQDGTHVVFIKIWDGYGITSLYSTLINIDNTPPSLNLELPLDDSKTTKNVFFSGQTTDNIALTDLYITIRSLENKTIPERLARRNLEPEEIISQVLDISELNNGFYNIELTGTDAAGNITRVSRNIELDKTKPLAKVNMLYPLNGEHLQGEFNIYGTAYTEKGDDFDRVDLYIDGRKMEELGDINVTENGYFNFRLKPVFKGEIVKETDEEGKTVEKEIGGYVLADGKHSYQTIATTKSGRKIISNPQTFIYSSCGPWVTLDNFTYGDFAMNRPLLKGNAGYILSAEEQAALKSKETSPELRAAIQAKKVKQVFLSFDNGKTYIPVSKENKGAWSYRIENLDIPAGFHFMLVKAEMMNGESAITRTIVQIDRTNPSIRLISPGEGGHYNQRLKFEGLSGDDIDLKDVRLTLRQGDKASYEIPGFIQGLYFDANVWGMSFYSVGVGLTAFDNAVKVQVSFGQHTLEQRNALQELFGQEKDMYRFGGNIYSGKIIAQLLYIPFRYFWGRDWDWLSASVSIGAIFSYCTDSGASVAEGTNVPQTLSAVFMDIEFPRITLAKQKMFRTWSFYGEPQLWFIPSDVGGDAAKYLWTASFGLRTTLF